MARRAWYELEKLADTLQAEGLSSQFGDSVMVLDIESEGLIVGKEGVVRQGAVDRRVLEELVDHVSKTVDEAVE